MNMLESKVITLGDVTITVQQATTLAGMKRARMKSEAIKVEDTDPDIAGLRLVVYPDVVAGTVSIEGTTMPTFDEFVQLPESYINPWLEAVYSLNPHWLAINEIAAQEKKAFTSGSDLSDLSNETARKKATRGRRSR